jgi:hypothetical protein
MGHCRCGADLAGGGADLVVTDQALLLFANGDRDGAFWSAQS